jgi:hypothetical protein
MLLPGYAKCGKKMVVAEATTIKYETNSIREFSLLRFT